MGAHRGAIKFARRKTHFRGLVGDQGRRLRRHKDARARNALGRGRARDGGSLRRAQRDCAPILVTSAAPTVTVIVPHDGKKKDPTKFSSGMKGPAAGPGRRTSAPCGSLPRAAFYGTVVVPGRRKKALPGRSGRPIWADCRGNAAGAEFSVSTRSRSLPQILRLSSLKN